MLPGVRRIFSISFSRWLTNHPPIPPFPHRSASEWQCLPQLPDDSHPRCLELESDVVNLALILGELLVDLAHARPPGRDPLDQRVAGDLQQSREAEDMTGIAGS